MNLLNINIQKHPNFKANGDKIENYLTRSLASFWLGLVFVTAMCYICLRKAESLDCFGTNSFPLDSLRYQNRTITKQNTSVSRLQFISHLYSVPNYILWDTHTCIRQLQSKHEERHFIQSSWSYTLSVIRNHSTFKVSHDIKTTLISNIILYLCKNCRTQSAVLGKVGVSLYMYLL